MKKFALFFSAAAVLCILTGLTAYHRSFPLDADLNGLEPAALQWFNRGRSVPCEADQLELYQPVTVGRLTYYPLVLDGRLGYLCLSRGFTGRYKFDHSGRGTGSFRNGVVESDGEQMLLFEGRNGDGPHRPGGLFTGGRWALCAGHSGLSRLSGERPGGGHRPHRTCQYRGYHLL